jgi:hypothetical protein
MTSTVHSACKYAGKLLIKPARKNVKAFLGKVRQIVKANKQAKTGNLIAQLNPVIRGWANYHWHVVSKRTVSVHRGYCLISVISISRVLRSTCR